MIRTERLLLRQWDEADFPYFAEMGKDPKVMQYFPSLLAEAESYAMARKVQSLIQERGWGFWAVELLQKQKFIGFVGLHTPKMTLPFSPCVEIGWRLASKHWGQGYATEAAKAALKFAFTELQLNEVVSFTANINKASQGVMKKIGMYNTGDNFMHPDVEQQSPLQEHVLFNITQAQWQKNC